MRKTLKVKVNFPPKQGRPEAVEWQFKVLTNRLSSKNYVPIVKGKSSKTFPLQRLKECIVTRLGLQDIIKETFQT